MALVDGGDPALSAHPLGVLLARQVIDADHYAAGVRYAFLFGKVFGRTKIVAHYADILVGSRDRVDLSESDATRYEAALRRCWHAIAPLGIQAKRLLDDVAVYERFPAWALSDRASGGDHQDRRLLRSALSILAGRTGGHLGHTKPSPGTVRVTGSAALSH
jgi:hypothetical protein